MILKKLDRFIIRKFLSSFFFTALLFSMIAVVIDFSQRVDKVLSIEMPARQVLHFYLNFVPFINGLLWPLFALIAVIFFTSRMAKNSEIISIFNAGVSFWRFLVPFLLAASLITAILLFANHRVIPVSNYIMNDYEQSFFNRKTDQGRANNVLLFLDPNNVAYIRVYIKNDTVARDVRLETYKDGELKSILKAKEMKWIQKSSKWRIRNYEIRHIEGEKETLILENKGVIDTSLNITHDDFVSYKNEKQAMTTSQLQRFIDAERNKGIGNSRSYLVEKHRRTAEPVTILILTIIGVSVASRKVRGGMGLHLAIGISLGALFIFISKFSITFATNESLHPLIGVWIPNLVFMFFAMILLRQAQK